MSSKSAERVGGRRRHDGPRRDRTPITQAQVARRERRTLEGREGLTGPARDIGMGYPPLNGAVRDRPYPPPAPPAGPASGQRRGRRRPDGHRRAGENAANGWTS